MKIVFNDRDMPFGICLKFGKDSFAHFENDWPQIWGRYNWKTYRVADIYYEDDVMLGGHEFRFVLFGFGIRIRVNNPDHPGMKDLNDKADAAMKGIDEHHNSRPMSQFKEQQTDGSQPKNGENVPGK